MPNEGLCPTKWCAHRSDPDWHIPICGHGLEGHHHHVVKRSQGGSDGDIVFICPKCHDQIDNGMWINGTMELPDGTRRYFLLDEHGKTIVDRVIGETDGTQEAQVRTEDSPTLQEGEARTREGSLRLLPIPREPSHPSIELTPTGLKVTGRPTFEDWKQTGVRLKTVGESWRWCLGDWLNLADDFGEEASQFLEDYGSFGSLENYRWLARAFPESTRGRLSWTHHRVVAKLEPEKREEMLALAEKKNWTSHELAAAIKPPSDTPICAHTFVCTGCGAKR